MSAQIKHRILGIVVVIALVILLLPFLQTEKDNRIEMAHDQAPPFPAPSEQIIADEIITTPIQEITKPQEQTNEATLANAVAAEESGTDVPADSNVIPIASPIKTDSIHASNSHEKYREASKKQYKTKLSTHKKNNISSADKNGLLQLTEATWVIQLGSFNNKSQALQLINQLRANGYPAFMQTISTGSHRDIRVYVGPENGQKQAFKLADKIEHDMQLQGMVISYQPLAL